jgi:hypothetical protein
MKKENPLIGTYRQQAFRNGAYDPKILISRGIDAKKRVSLA